MSREVRYKQRGLQFTSAEDSRALRAVDSQTGRRARRDALLSRKRMDGLEVLPDKKESKLLSKPSFSDIGGALPRKSERELGLQRYQELLKWREDRRKKLNVEKRHRKPSFKTGVFQPDQPKYLVSDDVEVTDSKQKTPAKPTPYKYLQKSATKSGITPGTSMRKIPIFHTGVTPGISAPKVPKFNLRTTPNQSLGRAAILQRRTIDQKENLQRNANSCQKVEDKRRTRMKATTARAVDMKRILRARGTRRRDVTIDSEDLGVKALPVSPEPVRRCVASTGNSEAKLLPSEDNVIASELPSFAPENFAFNFNVQRCPGKEEFKAEEDSVFKQTVKSESEHISDDEADRSEVRKSTVGSDGSVSTNDLEPALDVPDTVIDGDDDEGEETDKDNEMEEDAGKVNDIELTDNDLDIANNEMEDADIENEIEDAEIDNEIEDADKDNEIEDADIDNEIEDAEIDHEKEDADKDNEIEDAEIDNEIEDADINVEKYNAFNESKQHADSCMEEITEVEQKMDEEEMGGILKDQSTIDKETTNDLRYCTDDDMFDSGKAACHSVLEDSIWNFDCQNKTPKSVLRRSTRRSTRISNVNDTSLTPMVSRLRPRTPCSRSTRRSLSVHCDYPADMYTPSRQSSTRRSVRRSVNSAAFKSINAEEPPIPIDFGGHQSTLVETSTEDNPVPVKDDLIIEEETVEETINITPVINCKTTPKETEDACTSKQEYLATPSSCRRRGKVSWMVEESPFINIVKRSGKSRRSGVPADITALFHDVPTDGSPLPAHLTPLLDKSWSDQGQSPVTGVIQGDSPSVADSVTSPAEDQTCSNLLALLKPTTPVRNETPDIDVWGEESLDKVDSSLVMTTTAIETNTVVAVTRSSPNVVLTICSPPVTRRKSCRMSLLPGMSDTPMEVRTLPVVSEDLISWETPMISSRKKSKMAKERATPTPSRRSRRLSKACLQ